ncbi:MAG: hypothetical protein ACE5IY_04150 [bacterium]
MKTLKNFLKPKFILEWRALWKEYGFKEFLRRKGWKVIVVIFVFYLVRDSFLYLLLPYLAARGLLGC